MTSRRRALLVGTQNYVDLSPLPSTRVDLDELSKVLSHPEVGGFEVEVRMDRTANEMQADIASFLGSARADELILVYITGHGLRYLESGEFYFAAVDTRLGDPAASGMSAGFFNEELEGCQAAQKVAILDCCYSASTAVGFRSSVAKSAAPAHPVEGAASPIKSRGVYVLASSGAGETSAAGAVSETGIEPSVFTAALVHGLRTGQADRDGDGYIGVSELFIHASEHIQKRESVQTPHQSAIGVTAELLIARNCENRPLSLMLVPPGQPTFSPRLSGVEQQRTRLLNYYQYCITADNEPHSWLKPGEEGRRFVVLRGRERLISGDLDADGFMPIPDEAKSLVDSSDPDEVGLWCGYPMVALRDKRNAMKLAPLVMRRLEVVERYGQKLLETYGPVQPHPDLVADLLSEDDKDALLATFTQEWPPGGHHQMVQALRHLLTQELEIADVEKLNPVELSEKLDLRSANTGARNAAVIFQARREDSSTKALLKDLTWIANRPHTIRGTALEALLDNDRHVLRAGYNLVTPMLANAGQLAIIDAAMTRRLTVGTGPPGTGKTQLVVNLSATAIGSDQSVLIASTNNEAVDEVWRRAEKLAPGAIVRTGSVDNGKPKEKASLAQLQRLRVEHHVQTSLARLRAAQHENEKVQDELAALAQTEARLLQLGERRAELADRLGLALRSLTETFAREMQSQVQRLAGVWLFPATRRRRWLRLAGLDLPPSQQVFDELTEFASCEKQWRAALRACGDIRDEDLVNAMENSDERVRESSERYLRAVVAENVNRHRRKISELIQATANGLDRTERGETSGAIRGWAVTSLSAGCFPNSPKLFDLVVIDEASQCSIPSIVPLLYRAKRALIIGDPMQLAHISRISPAIEMRARRNHNIDSVWLERNRLSYSRHSAYRAAERSVGEPLLLAEHFRCHPDIIGFSNERFYGGRLRVLTDVAVRTRAENLQALRWFDAKGDLLKTSDGWINRAEVKLVNRLVKTLLERLPSEARVGVVTPLRAHKEALQRACASLDQERVRVGTVHTFQGGECEAIVFSLVAAEGMASATIGWLEGRVNLWNVAITRAKTHLLVVGDRDFWRRRPGVGQELVNTADNGAAPLGEIAPLQQLLFEKVSGHLPVELSVARNGYVADAVVDNAGVEIPILLDIGHSPAEAGAEHLRLQLNRTRLFGDSAMRLPAWRLFDDDENLIHWLG